MRVNVGKTISNSGIHLRWYSPQDLIVALIAGANEVEESVRVTVDGRQNR